MSPQSFSRFCNFFFFNDTATTEIYTLSLHDALPIFAEPRDIAGVQRLHRVQAPRRERRSEEHTSELQSPVHLVCRLLLEKKQRRPLCRRRQPPHPRFRDRWPSIRAVGTSSIRTAVFFFNDTAPPEIYTLSLHDALPISAVQATELPIVEETPLRPLTVYGASKA